MNSGRVVVASDSNFLLVCNLDTKEEHVLRREHRESVQTLVEVIKKYKKKDCLLWCVTVCCVPLSGGHMSTHTQTQRTGHQNLKIRERKKRTFCFFFLFQIKKSWEIDYSLQPLSTVRSVYGRTVKKKKKKNLGFMHFSCVCLLCVLSSFFF